MRVKGASTTVHVNHWSDETLQSSRTTDMKTVAAVFMSRHAHDMMATRKMRFLDAAIFLFPVLVVLEEPLVRTRTFFVISYHDILNRSAKNMFYFLLVAKKIQMNIHKSLVVTRDNRSGRNVTNQAEQNRKCAAPNEMDPFATL